MAGKHDRLSVEDLDAMTPNERAQAVRDRIVTDPDDLPEDFRRKIFARARELGATHDDPS